MGNCLVTKLKGVVNNPDLLKLNEIRFRVTIGRLGLSCTQAGKIYAINSTTFPDGTTEKNLSTGWNYIQYEDGHPFDVSVDKSIISNVDIGNNYSNTGNKLISNPGFWHGVGIISGLNFDNIPFDSDTLTTIAAAAQGRCPNFNPDSNLPELTSMQLSANNNSIVQFSKYTKLTLWSYSGSNLYGEIVSFLNAMAENRTSGTLRLVTNNITTYNGVATVLDASLYFNFGTSMVNPTAEDTERGWQVAS